MRRIGRCGASIRPGDCWSPSRLPLVASFLQRVFRRTQRARIEPIEPGRALTLFALRERRAAHHYPKGALEYLNGLGRQRSASCNSRRLRASSWRTSARSGTASAASIDGCRATDRAPGAAPRRAAAGCVMGGQPHRRVERGCSFRAFWDFLMSQTRQDELTRRSNTSWGCRRWRRSNPIRACAGRTTTCSRPASTPGRPWPCCRNRCGNAAGGPDGDITRTSKPSPDSSRCRRGCSSPRTEINFLALPLLPDCAAIFRVSYGPMPLFEAAWLRDRSVYH